MARANLRAWSFDADERPASYPPSRRRPAGYPPSERASGLRAALQALRPPPLHPL